MLIKHKRVTPCGHIMALYRPCSRFEHAMNKVTATFLELIENIAQKITECKDSNVFCTPPLYSPFAMTPFPTTFDFHGGDLILLPRCALPCGKPYNIARGVKMTQLFQMQVSRYWRKPRPPPKSCKQSFLKTISCLSTPPSAFFYHNLNGSSHSVAA